MSETKYRIPLGNCENGLNQDILGETVIDGSITADTTLYFADDTVITADNS